MTCERVLIIIRGNLRADSRVTELRTGNTAVVTIEAGASGVADVLRAVPGAASVESDPPEHGWRRWRVHGDDHDLCPALFEALRSRPWKVTELRSEAKTLETVFRELAEAAPGAGPSSGHRSPTKTPARPAVASAEQPS